MVRELSRLLAVVLSLGLATPAAAQIIQVEVPVGGETEAGLAGAASTRLEFGIQGGPALSNAVSLSPGFEPTLEVSASVGTPLPATSASRPPVSAVSKAVAFLLGKTPVASAAGRLVAATSELSQERRSGTSQDSTLTRLFTSAAVSHADDPESPAPQADAPSPKSETPVPAGLETFVRSAEQKFHAGRLAEGQHGAVFYKQPAARTEGVPSEEEMRAEMARSPLTNPEREAVITELFVQAGADPARIVTQDAGRDRHNIYVVKPATPKRGVAPALARGFFGAANFLYNRILAPVVGLDSREWGRARVIVVGAHHDKVSEGAGTIDNWTGATMVTNLYQAMKDVPTDATYVFIAFAREEEGLLGSKFWVDSLRRDDPQTFKNIDAMVNLDTLAVDGTYSWKNNSTRALLDLVRRVADAEKRDLTEAVLHGGDADSSTFRQAGIPAVTLYGASADVIFDIIHSERDTMAVFNLQHYVNAYLLTFALLKALDLTIIRRAGAPV